MVETSEEERREREVYESYLFRGISIYTVSPGTTRRGDKERRGEEGRREETTIPGQETDLVVFYIFLHVNKSYAHTLKFTMN